jgi:hypothetical protein
MQSYFKVAALIVGLMGAGSRCCRSPSERRAIRHLIDTTGEFRLVRAAPGGFDGAIQSGRGPSAGPLAAAPRPASPRAARAGIFKSTGYPQTVLCRGGRETAAVVRGLPVQRKGRGLAQGLALPHPSLNRFLGQVLESPEPGLSSTGGKRRHVKGLGNSLTTP